MNNNNTNDFVYGQIFKSLFYAILPCSIETYLILLFLFKIRFFFIVYLFYYQTIILY